MAVLPGLTTKLVRRPYLRGEHSGGADWVIGPH